MTGWYHLALGTESSAELSWPDSQLVQECLAGNEKAWSGLIDKYKNLIYSVPIRQGFSQADASDIFQSVVAELLSHLGDLRDPNALPGWLIQVTSHKCNRWRRERVREAAPEESETATRAAAEPGPTPEGLLHDAMREQILRQAVANASPRCRELIRMLFFENSARPYLEIAASLGIATGSIGFIRRRCLDRLRKYLLEAGLR
jgi:RNA polymerase sigma factor (sigma-70 family)